MVRMHADELVSDASLARRLIDTQFPQWAALPIRRLASWGTDNAIYRLGPDMAIRLPRRPSAAGQLRKEWQWLPKLAPQLPLPVPVPIARGVPAEDYASEWAVYSWLEGTDATVASINTPQGARDLAGFILALRKIDATGGPQPGAHNSHRGVPLTALDASFWRFFAALQKTPDALDAAGEAAVVSKWEAALAAPVWDGPPLWLHGDLLPGNLLVDASGRLSGVLDFGLLGVGDPACDVMAGWSVFSGEAREAFRAELDTDDATWARARGWALWQGVAALSYYFETNPILAGVGRRAIAEVLADRD